MDSSQVVNRRLFGERISTLRLHVCVVALVGAAWLGGCGWLEPEQAVEDAAEIERRVAGFRGSRPENPGYRSLRTADGPYLAVRPVFEERAELPEELRAESGLVVPLVDIPGDESLAKRIEEAAGLSVRLVGRATDEGTDPDEARVGTPDTGGHAAGWMAALRDDLTLQGGLFVGPGDRLLDKWTAAAGYEWQYLAESQTIEVVRWKTQIFQINALTGETTYNSRISTSGGGGDETSGTSGQSIRTDMEYKPWEDIRKEVGALLGVDGERPNERGESAVVSPSWATVTVTGLPRTIERVRQYLWHLNRNILRPITLSAHLYALRMDKGSDLELGLAGVIPQIFGSDFRVNVNGGTISIVRPTVASRSSLNATVTALRTVGTASRLLSADIPSLNGQPTEFFDVFDHRYLKEIETSTDDGVVNVKLKPGEVWSGFGLSYVGRIVGNDAVLARITVTIQDAPTFTVFGAAGNQIQLPSAGRRAVVVTQHIERGAVLLLSGFSDRQSSETRAGTFDPNIPLPEGERRGNVDRVETVLLVTADAAPPMGITEMSGGRGFRRQGVAGTLVGAMEADG